MNAHYPMSADYHRRRSSAAPLFSRRIVLLIIGLPVAGSSPLIFTLPTLTGAHLPVQGLCVAVFL